MMKTPSEIIFSDEYHDAVPRPTMEEWQALSLSIQEDGLREHIVVNQNGVILDGYTRYEICRIHKIELQIRTQRFTYKTDELRYIHEVNAIRRQLTPFQRVEQHYDMYLTYKKESLFNRTQSSTNKKRIRLVVRLFDYQNTLVSVREHANLQSNSWKVTEKI